MLRRMEFTGNRTILLTGVAGFIGSTLVRELLRSTKHHVVGFDALTYAGNLSSLRELEGHRRFEFVKGDICSASDVEGVFRVLQPDTVMHLAAESHVDRSIDGPAEFIQTNAIGTLNLLEAANRHWVQRTHQRFIHVSTDEVFGSLAPDERPFSHETRYDPRSPYSASKAASDHLVRAWNHTFGLPTIVTNCSNNYGARQFPEKLIPKLVLRGSRGLDLPIYGSGSQIRDWLHVNDHARGLIAALEHGLVGDTYLFGGDTEKTNLQIAEHVCALLDELRPTGGPHRRLIQHVADRPGHDQRYAIEATAAKTKLGWSAQKSFEDGLFETVLWYLENQEWVSSVAPNSASLERIGLREETK